MTTTAGSFYYHYDPLGNVVNLTDASGATQWTYSYEPYGNPLTTTQNGGSAPANPIRYSGQYLDTTGLYNLRARQYDPTTGRFNETDPSPGGLTDPYVAAYIYGADDPTRYDDPSGRDVGHAGEGAEDAFGAGWDESTLEADNAKIAAQNASKRWNVGDPLDAPTAQGEPSRSTIRARFWKTTAAQSTGSEASAENLSRMQRGLAPRGIDPGTGRQASMELHHDPAWRLGGRAGVKPLWPSEHSAIDPFRHLGGR